MSEERSTPEDREMELRLVRTLSGITAGGLTVFAIMRFAAGHYAVLGVILVSLAVAMGGLVSVWALNKPRCGAHLTLAAATIALGASHILDGLIHSPSLWVIWVVPIAAGLLLGKGAILVYAAVAALFNYAAWSGPSWGFQYGEQLETPHLDWVLLRILAIVSLSIIGNRIVRRTEASLYETARRSLELEASHALAQAFDQEKTRFLSQMSHEIRTPMNGIKGMVQLWRREELSPTMRDSVDVMDRCADHLMALMSDIQDLSKIESGNIETFARPFLVNIAVRDVARLFEAKAQAKGLSLLVDGPTQDVWARGDAQRMVQVLSNLVGNAVKFTDQGSVSIRWEAREDETCVFSVEDQGIGMSPTQVESLFQKYAQVDLDQGVARGGTGLGLTISKALAEAMGGSLSVRSELGVGSVFVLELRMPKANPLAGEGASPRPMDKGAHALAVLLVDDDPVSLLVQRLALEHMGCDVVACAGSLEAIEAAKASAFDLILMDLCMPGLDGVATTRAIREQALGHRSTPVIATTASAYLEDHKRCLEAGMQDVLVKPIDFEKLERCLANCRDHAPGEGAAA